MLIGELELLGGPGVMVAAHILDLLPQPRSGLSQQRFDLRAQRLDIGGRIALDRIAAAPRSATGG